MTANTTFVASNVLTAAQMNALPWGIVDTTAGGTSSRGFYNKSNGNFAVVAPFASATQITDFSITFTPVTGRLYKASYAVRFSFATAQFAYTQFRIGGTIYAGKADFITTGGEQTATNFYIFSGLTVSTTIQVFAAAQTTSVGSNAIFDSVGAAGTFCIEDIGPA